MAIDTRIMYQNAYDRIRRMADLLKIGTRVRVIHTENRNLWLRAGTVIGKAGLDEYDVKIDEYKGYTSDGVFRFSSHQIEILDTDSDYPKLTPPSVRKPYDDPDCLRDWYRYIANSICGMPKKEETMKTVPTYSVKKIIYNPPATIVFWEDGSKTVVKCSKDDEYSPYFGFLAALAKKVYGNPSRVRKIVDKWAPEEEEQYYKFTIRIKFATNSLTDTNQEQYMVVTDFMETYKNTIGKRLWVCSDLIKTVSTNGGEVEIVAESPKPLSIDEKLYIQYAVERDLEEFYAVSDVDITSCPIEKKDDKE